MTMIFASSYSRRVDVLDAAVRPVLKQSATTSGDGKDQPREDPPKWSTLQQIPAPVDRLKLINEYFLSKKETAKSQVVVNHRYSSDIKSTGLLLDAVV